MEGRIKMPTVRDRNLKKLRKMKQRARMRVRAKMEHSRQGVGSIANLVFTYCTGLDSRVCVCVCVCFSEG